MVAHYVATGAGTDEGIPRFGQPGTPGSLRRGTMRESTAGASFWRSRPVSVS
jgi:hypothetical protein